MDLEVYSTKLRPETKKRLRALAETGPFSGQRELIEELIRSYERSNTQAAIMADQYQEVVSS